MAPLTWPSSQLLIPPVADHSTGAALPVGLAGAIQHLLEFSTMTMPQTSQTWVNTYSFSIPLVLDAPGVPAFRVFHSLRQAGLLAQATLPIHNCHLTKQSRCTHTHCSPC